jgi:hypothetical protein
MYLQIEYSMLFQWYGLKHGPDKGLVWRTKERVVVKVFNYWLKKLDS